VLGANAQVPHYQFRPSKHPGIEALQDKVPVSGGPQGYEKGVIDVAAAVFPDARNPAPGGKLLGGGEKMIQGFASALKSSRFKVQRMGRGLLQSQAPFHNLRVDQRPMRNCFEKIL
jgi:hypothetical protein